MAYEELEHTADWALRVWGSDLAALFVDAVAGMLELAGVELAQDSGAERSIEIDSLDPESLLVDFLTEQVVALELRGVAFQDIRIDVASQGEHRLSGTLREAPVRSISKHIKAVTYNELEIEYDGDSCSATIVFDV